MNILDLRFLYTTNMKAGNMRGKVTACPMPNLFFISFN
jgi:hypothetical protein